MDDPAREMAVLGTELRLFKEELSRRFNEQRDEFRSLRGDMGSNYVGLAQHASDLGRLSDRIANVEGDVIDIRTTLAAQFAGVQAHIDRKFEEQAEQRRWSTGQIVAVACTFLVAASGLGTAVLELAAHH